MLHPRGGPNRIRTGDFLRDRQARTARLLYESVNEVGCGRWSRTTLGRAYETRGRPLTHPAINAVNPDDRVADSRSVKVSLEDLLRRAVYGPDDQCLQPGCVCPMASIESRHVLNFAATGVTGFMTETECMRLPLLSTAGGLTDL